MTNLVRQPVYALCGVGFYSRWPANELPYRGRALCENWDPDPAAPGGFRGLAWGKGDPEAAFLCRQRSWAVVRIDDPCEPVPVPGAVKFRACTVCYYGDRRGALETLLQLGADPAVIRLAGPGPDGIARTGTGGVAVAGRGGYAWTGDFGEALAQEAGIAIAGSGGMATVTGFSGLAVSGGRAEAGSSTSSIAVTRGGEDCAAVAGFGGIAVALARANEVGAGGRAVALGGADFISIGSGGIAVALDAQEGFDLVHAGARALVILRISENSSRRFVVGVAGENGLTADTNRAYWQGRWVDPQTLPERGVQQPAKVEEDPALKESPWPRRWVDLWLDDLPNACPVAPVRLGADSIVLCGTPSSDVVRDRSLEATDWDPSPTSNTGYFGLLWGVGDAVAGRLLRSEKWMLVRVSSFEPVIENGIEAAVRFRKGQIICSGSRMLVLVTLLRLTEKPPFLANLAGRLSPWRSVQTLSGEESALAKRLAVSEPEGVAAVEDEALAVAGSGGWALAGCYADAAAGSGGVAVSEYCGHSEAGADGIAISDEQGFSSAGPHGIALNRGKRYGHAVAGDGGVAIGDGRFKQVQVGMGGLAINTAHGGWIVAGDGGVAIGDGRVQAGEGGVAIGIWGTVSGGPGCLLVRRWRDAEGQWRYATGIVGLDGILPDTDYDAHDGMLRPASEIP